MFLKTPSEVELYIKEAIEHTEEKYKELINKSVLSLREKALIEIAALKTTQKILKNYDRFMTEIEKDMVYNDVLHEKCVKSIIAVKDSGQMELSEEVIEKAAFYLSDSIEPNMFINEDILDAIEEALEEIKAEELAGSDEYDF